MDGSLFVSSWNVWCDTQVGFHNQKKNNDMPHCSWKLNRERGHFTSVELHTHWTDVVGKGPGRGSCGVSQLKGTYKPCILNKQMKENESSSRKNGNVRPALPFLLRWGSTMYHPCLNSAYCVSLTFGFINSTTSLLHSPRIRIQSFFPGAAFLCVLTGRQGLQKVTPYRKYVVS